MKRAPILFLAWLLAAAPAAHGADDTNSGPVVTPPAADTAPADTNLAPSAPPLPAAPNPNAAGTGMPQLPPGLAGQTAAPPDIADIRPPFFYLVSLAWLWIALLVLLLVALLFLVWKWLRPKPFLSAKSAYDQTLENLEKARALLDERNPMPYAVFVSETIRGYLGHRFQTPSTRRTTEEFLEQMEADKNSPLAEHRDLLRQFLQACDMVKFARYQPRLAELEQVQESATGFVLATKPEPEPAHAKGGRR